MRFQDLYCIRKGEKFLLEVVGGDDIILKHGIVLSGLNFLLRVMQRQGAKEVLLVLRSFQYDLFRLTAGVKYPEEISVECLGILIPRINEILAGNLQVHNSVQSIGAQLSQMPSGNTDDIPASLKCLQEEWL